MPGRSTICSIDGCDRDLHARARCLRHYVRDLRSGLLVADQRTPYQRFWDSVCVTDSCWLWVGFLRDGYGSMLLDGKRSGVHRISYQWLVGPIPDGLQLDHLCRVRNCVNPEHLEPVTQRVNILRGRGAAVGNLEKTECPRGHAYAGENLRVYSGGGRECAACGRARNKAWREAHKSA